LISTVTYLDIGGLYLDFERLLSLLLSLTLQPENRHFQLNDETLKKTMRSTNEARSQSYKIMLPLFSTLKNTQLATMPVLLLLMQRWYA
jgi:hypothetical protein